MSVENVVKFVTRRKMFVKKVAYNLSFDMFVVSSIKPRNYITLPFRLLDIFTFFFFSFFDLQKIMHDSR